MLSDPWKNRCEHQLLARDVFAGGPLAESLQTTPKNVWCLQVPNIFPDMFIRENMETIRQHTCRQKLGKANSPTEADTKYFTQAWRRRPCVCEYRYGGNANHFIDEYDEASESPKAGH